MSETRKTTVYLDAADYRQLKAIAREQKRPAADLVREAVAEYAAARAPRIRPTSLGAGRSRRGDISVRAEAMLTGMGRKK
jgi:hypothetical protein